MSFRSSEQNAMPLNIYEANMDWYLWKSGRCNEHICMQNWRKCVKKISNKNLSFDFWGRRRKIMISWNAQSWNMKQWAMLSEALFETYTNSSSVSERFRFQHLKCETLDEKFNLGSRLTFRIWINEMEDERSSISSMMNAFKRLSLKSNFTLSMTF